MPSLQLSSTPAHLPMQLIVQLSSGIAAAAAAAIILL